MFRFFLYRDKSKTETDILAAIRRLKTVPARGPAFFRLVAVTPATGHTELTFYLSFEKLGIGGIFPFAILCDNERS